MFVWVLNTTLLTTIFPFRKRSEWKNKQSSNSLSNELKKFSNSKKKGAGMNDTYEPK